MMIKKMTGSDIKVYRESIYELIQIDYVSTYGCEMSKSFVETKIDAIPSYIEAGRATVFGSMDEEKLIGFVWAYPVVTPFETVMHVAYIAVKADGRRKGIGSKLLRAVEKEANTMGMNHVELIVGTNNKSARVFYDREGYMEDRLILRKKVL